MRRLLSATLASLGLFALVAVAARADDADIRKEIQAQYEKIAAAYQSGDVSAYDSAALPDAKYITLLGKEQPKADWLAEKKQAVGAVKGAKVTAEILTTAVKGDEATSIALVRIVGETEVDGKVVPLDLKNTERAVWVKGDGGWKIKLLKHVRADGKRDNRTIRFPGTPEAEELRKALQPLYDLICDIYQKQDWAVMEKGMPEDYAATDANGTPLTKKDVLQRVKDGAKMLVSPTMFITIQQVAVEGDKAKIVRVMRVISDIKLPDGKMTRMGYLSVARDSYTKKGKDWSSKVSDELYSEATLDGKPVPLSAIGGK